jgi:glycosyltransferase involved in cell wall biosynthesis
MKVLIDVQALQSPLSRERGIGRYARGLVQALRTSRPAWNIATVANDALPGLVGLNDFHFLFKPPLPTAPEMSEVNARFYGDWLIAQKPDVVLFLHTQDEHVLLPRFAGPHPRMAGVLYDVIPLLFADQYLRNRKTRDQYAHGFRALCACDDIMAISRASADDFRRVAPDCGNRLTVIGGAVDPYFSPESTDQEPAPGHLPVRGDFMLYVGGFDFRKNWKTALEAYASLASCEREGLGLPGLRRLSPGHAPDGQASRTSFSFVMACALEPAERRTITSHAKELGIAESLYLTGHVSDRDLRWLYRHCRLLFFPSLYEGLGLPVLEALACGAPVVTSSGSSLGECGGNVSWLVDPADVADCRHGLCEALAEPRQARFHERPRHAANFSWNDVGEKAARCLERRSPPSRINRRHRVAWVSPMPPAETGVADYSALLIEGLRDRYEIDVVSDHVPRYRPHRSVEEGISSHHAQPYDAFVYQLGNSRFHVYMLPLLARYRGLVALHDIHLDGLLLAAIREGLWTRSLNRELELSGELSLAHALECGEIMDHDAAQPFRPLDVAAPARPDVFGGGRRGGSDTDSPPFPAWLLSRASRLIVHSHWSHTAVSAWTDRPIDFVPLPLSPASVDDPLAARRRLGISADRFVLVALGTVGPASRVSSILKAVARVPPVISRQCCIYLVGAVPGMLRRELMELAQRLGLADQITFTGRVPADDFSAYARVANLCIQLRHPTRGESSAALLQALAAGAPCLISGLGPAENIPTEVAIRIRPGPCEVDDLVAAVVRLFHDGEERRRLGQAAAAYAREAHSLPVVVGAYQGAIDLAIAERKRFAWLETACQALSCLSGPVPDHVIKEWARLRGEAVCSRVAIAGTEC